MLAVVLVFTPYVTPTPTWKTTAVKQSPGLVHVEYGQPIDRLIEKLKPTVLAD